MSAYHDCPTPQRGRYVFQPAYNPPMHIHAVASAAKAPRLELPTIESPFGKVIWTAPKIVVTDDLIARAKAMVAEMEGQKKPKRPRTKGGAMLRVAS